MLHKVKFNLVHLLFISTEIYYRLVFSLLRDFQDFNIQILKSSYISYDNTYMWKLKKNCTNEPIYEIKIESQM